MKANKLEGIRFNMLQVVRDGGRDSRGNVLWECKCECGNTTLAYAYDLRAGKVKSCGCWARNGAKNKKHGYASAKLLRSKIYSIWAAMVQRCTNPKDKNWNGYGGRGINVYPPWRESFALFVAYIGEPTPGMSLDRIDNNLGYIPGNIRWSTQVTQARNKRSNVWVTMDDKTQILADWVKELNTSNAAICYWLRKGYTHAEVIERIARKNRSKENT